MENNDALLYREIMATVDRLKYSEGCRGVYLVPTRNKEKGINEYFITAVYADGVVIGRDISPVKEINERYCNQSMIDSYGRIIIEPIHLNEMHLGRMQDLYNCTVLYDVMDQVSNVVRLVQNYFDNYGCSDYWYDNLIPFVTPSSKPRS